MEEERTTKYCARVWRYLGLIVTSHVPQKDCLCAIYRYFEIFKTSMLRVTRSCHYFQSLNGIYLNGERVKPHCVTNVRENDLVGIGCPDLNVEEECKFVYRIKIERTMVCNYS